MILAVAGNSWAAALTASVTGDINVAATFGGTEFAAGDTITIADGVTLTIPVGVTAIVGSSPTLSTPEDISAPAIQCASTAGTGILIINGTLVFRGPILQANATWVANAGAVIHHDSSQSAVPADNHYIWRIGMVTDQPNAILKLTGTGTGSNRVTFTNAVGSANFGGFTDGATVRVGTQTVTVGLLGAGRLEGKWTNFTNLGYGTTQWATAQLQGATNRFSLENCIVDGCTGIVVGHGNSGIVATATFLIDKTTIKNPAQAASLYSVLCWTSQSITTGTRMIRDSVIEGGVQLQYYIGWSLQRVAIAITSGSALAPLSHGGGSSTNMVLLEDIFTYNRATAGGVNALAPAGTIMSRLVSLHTATTDNDHWRCVGPMLVDGWVAETATSAPSGGVFVSVAGGGSIKNGIAISDTNNNNTSNSVVALVGNHTPTTVVVENNTVIGKNGKLVTLEGATLVANTVQKVRNNIMYSPVPGTHYIVKQESASTIADASMLDCDYNARLNGTADGYDLDDAKYASPTPPGGHDITTADPGFLNKDFNFLVWGKTFLPVATTWDDIWLEIRKRNDDTGFNTAAKWESFYTAARAAFTPTNPALKGSGEGGVDIGAVAVQVAASARRALSVFNFGPVFGP